jgi:7-cyano-7-deazaguanine reductase
VLLDALRITVEPCAQPDPGLLARASGRQLNECLVSHLLRSHCPVTGQPDWASVQIRYHGHAWEHASVLRYLLSFRRHAEFHEHCVERIYHDLWQQLGPEHLSVYARYTRRGGIDINPYRSSSAAGAPENLRLVRQ